MLSPVPVPPNPWKQLTSKTVYDNRWIRVEEHEVQNPAGQPGIYGKVHFKNKAIGIVALDEHHHTWLVGQWRYTLNQWSWEIPEGGGALEADPLESAQRELREETGLTAQRWTLMQRTHLSNSVSDEEGFIFLAQDLTLGAPEREDTEADMKVWKLPFEKAYDMVLHGAITDSLSVMALLRTQQILFSAH
jgi:8-oxo-dGTP pyrophosphatase MutT (NUDIX family)